MPKNRCNKSSGFGQSTLELIILITGVIGFLVVFANTKGLLGNTLNKALGAQLDGYARQGCKLGAFSNRSTAGCDQITFGGPSGYGTGKRAGSLGSCVGGFCVGGPYAGQTCSVDAECY